MDPEQKTDREITYKVGWKRGKIQLNPNKLAGAEEPRPELEHVALSPKETIYLWNEKWIWKQTKGLSDTLLKLLLFAFPAVAFALSVWLVYQISIQP